MNTIQKAKAKAAANGWYDGKENSFAGPNHLYEKTQGLDLLFNTGFAKALWGEELKLEGCNKHLIDDCSCIPLAQPIWQYHQHQLLTEIQEGRDPWKYVAKFV